MFKAALKGFAIVVGGGSAILGALTAVALGLVASGHFQLNDAYDVLCNIEQKGPTYAGAWGAAAGLNGLRTGLPHAGRWIVSKIADAVTERITE